jgi:enoyl-CoA hydratase
VATGYRLEIVDGLAEIHLASAKANAMGPATLAALDAALAEAEAGPARGVVLTGYDRFFSAGLDLVALYDLDRPALDAFMRDFDRVMLRAFTFPRPLVAAVSGHAVAGGCVLALAADAQVLAARGARIGLNEIRLGVPFPAAALEIVRQAVPAQWLATVLYEGELHEGSQAVALGLATVAVDGDVLEEARRGCAVLASRPAAAFAEIKAALRAPAVARAREAQDHLRRAFVDAWLSPEGRRLIGEARDRLLSGARARPSPEEE